LLDVEPEGPVPVSAVPTAAPAILLGQAAPRLGVRVLAMLALATEIAIHVRLAPDHLSEVPYVGALFVTVSVVLAGVLVGVVTTPRERAVWATGAVTCLAMGGAFVLSRTVGLPDLHESWASDGGLGLVSLPVELAFLVCSSRVLLPAQAR
jgi:hypothetical protein